MLAALDWSLTNDRDGNARLGTNVNSSGLSITLINHGNLPEAEARGDDRPRSAGELPIQVSMPFPAVPFLRIPPFPGGRLQAFSELSGQRIDPKLLAEHLRRLRVGGTYWAAQPALPPYHVLVRCRGALEAWAAVTGADPLVLWESASAEPALEGIITVSGECDPWHMLSGAAALIAEPDDELRTIAALLDVPCFLFDPKTGELARDSAPVLSLVAHAVHQNAFENPFSGELMSPLEAAEFCGFWRTLIDSNRDVVGGLGFAFWKQDHVAPLLWNGSTPFNFLRGARDLHLRGTVAVWRAKAPSAAVAELEARQLPFVEVEDGFLRSRGLGADCIPPLSITVDRSGAYFDPSRESDLERILEHGRFDERLLSRARSLRRLIVQSGIGKYERGVTTLERPGGDRRHILVPGQVEDDRAVVAGGCGLVRNIDLLARVREQAPDAFILYKPHPDVLAGHRRGTIPDGECLRYADKIVANVPIASLIDMVDEVHVNSSLTGFEALLRRKPVTTHGVPFYAGWGLTSDLGPVPDRRTAKRTLDELVAATLLLYPRYLDPVTGLPCPAEVVVERLGKTDEEDLGLIVGLRRLQGKLMRRLRSLVQ